MMQYNDLIQIFLLKAFLKAHFMDVRCWELVIHKVIHIYQNASLFYIVSSKRAKKSQMYQWLGRASQWHDMFCS